MFPFLSIELKEQFDLDTVLHWGSLPKLVAIENQAEKIRYLQSYVVTYLKEEILVEQLIRQVNPFKDFLEIAAQMNGKIVSYSSIGRDILVDGKTVKQYYEILQDTYVGFLLPSFHLSIRKSFNKHPKFYFFDLGVKRALERTLQDRFSASTFTYGNHFESFVINEIYRLNEYLHLDYRLSYFQSKDGAEIDLILSRGRKNILIEIKSYTRVNSEDARKLAVLGSGVKGCEMYLLSSDREYFEIEKVKCINWSDFIKKLSAGTI